jgi:hypothetical protein
MKNYLYLYGNNSLKNNKFFIGQTDNEKASGVELQTQIIPRGSGTRVSSYRRKEKIIQVNGEVIVPDTSTSDIEKNITQLNAIFQKQKRMLRIMPEYTTVCDSSMIAQWTASDDATSLSADTTEFQFGDKSIKFNISVSNSANNYATLVANLSSPVNLTSFIDKNSLDFWLEIPDVYFVTSVDFRIGSDSSNYWSYNFTTNYEGLPFENGVNYFSCPFSASTTPPCFLQPMTATGSPNFGATDYVFFRINYSSSAINISNCRFGELFCVNESRTRNYLCYREDEVEIERNYDYSKRVRKYKAKLHNNVGYGQATHPRLVGGQNNVSTLDTTLICDFEGSFQPYPVATIKTINATNLYKLTLKNLQNQEFVELINEYSLWANNDKFIFDKFTEIDGSGRKLISRNDIVQDFEGKVPDFELGKNRLQFLVSLTGNSTGFQSTYNSFTQTAGNTLSAQSFVAGITGTLTNAKIFCRYYLRLKPKISIYSNSAGLPGTKIGDLLMGGITPGNTFQWLEGFGNISVTSGTTYWIVADHADEALNIAPYFMYQHWAYNSTSVTTGNRARFNGSTWTAEAGQDMTYQYTIEPVPSTNIDVAVYYTPLYA